jgi:hypothetical protein
MRLMKWLLLFALSLFIALVLVLTFVQPAFKVEVGAQILTHTTRPIPVYLYVLGAFIAGLVLGASAAVIGFVRAKAVEFRKNKRIRELENLLAEGAMAPGQSGGIPAALPKDEEF